VQRKPVQLEALRLHEPRPREDRGHVEVEPPERRDDHDSERRRHDHSRIQLEAGADTDGDDRLAERDQNDQPVSLREVLGRDPPAAPDADHDRAEVVDRERDEPDCDALAPLEEAGDHEQGGAEDRGRSEAEERAAAVGIVATDDGGENEMKQADEEVRDAEQHGVVSKGPRHRQGDAEHRAHRGEHHEPDATLVDIHRARQPRVDAPRPPEGGEDEHPAEDSTPRRVLREQSRHLRDPEHEDQIEEELERSDLVLVVLELALSVGHAPTLAQRLLQSTRLCAVEREPGSYWAPLSRRSFNFCMFLGISACACRRTTSGRRIFPIPCPSKSSAKVTRERSPSPSGSTVPLTFPRMGPSVP